MRYCSCNRGIRFSNRTSVVRNHRLGVDICSHCGGIVHDLSEDGNDIRRYDQFKSQAQIFSRNGNHLSSIEFYKKAHDAAFNYHENCSMLSAIAEEYEMLGDYASAEEYWNTCREVAEQFGSDYVYMYIARKGDFLYRIGRYRDAIGAYEQALKAINDMKDEFFSLKYYARIIHFISDSYDKLGEDNHKEKYLNELKKAIDRFIHFRRNDDYEVKANVMSKIAWEIYEDERLVDEALILIDSAIELHSGSPALDYMRKAKILQASFRYEEALENYDIALTKGNFEKEILKKGRNAKLSASNPNWKSKCFFKEVNHSIWSLLTGH